MTVSMSYGGASFRPVPEISISKTYQKNNAGIAVGTLFDVTLNGNLVQTSGAGGLPGTFSGIRAIRSAFDRDGKYFKIDCDGTVLFEGYPRIVEQIRFTESSDKWVFTCPYTLTLQFDCEPVNIGIVGSGENINAGGATLMPPYIASYDDTWSFEFDDNISTYVSSADVNTIPIVRATHDVSAQGKSHWKGPGLTGSLEQPAWVWAKDYVTSRLNISPSGVLVSGVFNLTLTGIDVYNHFRIQKIGESEGSFSVNETFIVSKQNGVLEDFNIDVSTQQESPYTNLVIQGSIQGLEKRSYGTATGDFSISQTKYENALSYYNSIADSALIYPRAQAVATGVTLNVEPLVKTIGHSPTKGTVTYNYNYNNRPSNCIAGAKTENIQISDENPTDVFSRLQIMGRSQGPILQSFNTVTDFKRTVGVGLLMVPVTGCSISILTGGNNPGSQVSSLLCTFEQDLKNRYDKVYKERDNVTWEPKTGRYSRIVSWAAVDCDTAPAILLCSGA